MSKEEEYPTLGEGTSRLVESWPNLMFLGLGVWWGWIWLLFNSVSVTALFPYEQQAGFVWQMYLVSTAAIALCMICCAIFWKPITKIVDNRGVVLGFGALASAATFLLVACEMNGIDYMFYAMTALTGVGTSALCVKAGRIYGSVTLRESLSSGCISLVVASGIYFAGIGIPQIPSIAFIVVLPFLSAVLLALPTAETFPSVIQGTAESLPLNSPERVMLIRVVAAVFIISFTSGVAKGVASLGGGTEAFAASGSIAVFVIALAGVVIMLLVERAKSAHGLRMVYTVLMAAGILEMLATCFGFNIFYLEVGKEVLWMVLFCFVAYLVFKFDFSAVRSFGFACAAYYIACLLGWLVGGLIAPYYAGDPTVRTGVGIALACLVIAVLLFVLAESDIRSMVERSCEQADAAQSTDAVIAVPEIAGEGSAQRDALAAASLEEVVTDDLSRAREPQYGLSERELEILEPFAQGRSASWIAEKYFISKNTVRSHLRNIYAKLDVHTRQELLDFLAGQEY